MVFKLAPQRDGSWTESLLHAFLDKPAKQPNARLVLDNADHLYSTTLYGGPADGGVVFKLTPESGGRWLYSVLHAFRGKPALNPRGLVLDKTGNLYGSAQAFGQGQNCSGVIYEITP